MSASSTPRPKQERDYSLLVSIGADTEEELIKQLLSITHSIKHGARTIEAHGKTVTSKALLKYNGTGT